MIAKRKWVAAGVIALATMGAVACGPDVQADDADGASADDASQPVVVTVLYNEPTDPEKFETYYAEQHLPLAGKMQGVDKVVLIKSHPGADGAKPAYYRIAQLYFSDAAQMEESMGSPEGQAVVADLPNFADKGVVVLTGDVT